jgi:predicted phosphodiesterase
MSRIGVIADIHGHLPGLKKTFKILEKERVDGVVVCGDVVGYGTSPNECCDRIRALNCPVAAGNHDWAVAGKTEYKESHSIKAIKGIDYTQKVISKENLRWLQSLPLHYKKNSTEFVHASLVEGEKWYYLTSRRFTPHQGWQDVRDCFAALKGRVCFVGHSHRPKMFLENPQGDIEVINPQRESHELQGSRAIIDVGSIGLPRGPSKQASLVVYDSANQTVHFRHFNNFDTPHPSQATAKKQKSSGKSTKSMISRWFQRNSMPTSDH